jgi:hypothetical protein
MLLPTDSSDVVFAYALLCLQHPQATVASLKATIHVYSKQHRQQHCKTTANHKHKLHIHSRGIQPPEEFMRSIAAK